MSVILNTFLLLTQISVIFTALPPIEKCQLNDSECLKKSGQNALPVLAAGISEVGSEILDPVKIDVIKVDLSGLKLNIKDAVITGLKNSVIDELSFDTTNKTIQLNFHVSPVTMKGKYTAEGRLLILPISGDGDVTFKIKKLEILLTMDYDIVQDKNGKDIIELKGYKYTFMNNVNTHYKLTNLFNGNKVLSDSMHIFMNDNWKAISEEFGDPILKKPLQKIFNAIRTYLKSQPLEEIANV